MSSLNYRKQKIEKLKVEWNLEKINNFLKLENSNHLINNLNNSIKLYISKALNFDLVLDDEFLDLVNKIKTIEQMLHLMGLLIQKNMY